ncbi:GSCOCG00006433001-RA-CDS [Cotesia congregata]|nr:GSCOCG00006433001-RA-CDS [Cotesia congregata]
MGIATLRKPFISDEHLTDLNLSHNHIWNVSSDVFEDLPSLVYLNLSHNFFPFSQLKFKNTSVLETLVLDEAHNYGFDITFTQDWTLPKLKHLYLRGHNIEHIKFAGVDALDLLMPEISHLYLSNNKLITFDLEKTLPMSLQELYLDDNKLTNFDADNLNNVAVLALDGNKMSNFCDINEPCKGITLKHSYSLEVLSVSRMGLENIVPDAFKFLVNLIKLDLSDNGINSFPSNALSDLLSIKILFIDNNVLEAVPEIKNLNHLEKLSLSKNLISELTENSFSGDLKQLKSLNLSSNIITSISSGAFDKLGSLEELDLSKNLLYTLPNDWIPDNVNLQYLQLKENFFQNFSSLALGRAKNLKYVSIGGNRFSAMDVGLLAELPKTAIIDFENTLP